MKRFANGEGYCRISLRRLARLSGLSKYGAQCGRQNLIQAKILEVTKAAPPGRRKRDGGGWWTAEYRLLDYAWRSTERYSPEDLQREYPGGVEPGRYSPEDLQGGGKGPPGGPSKGPPGGPSDHGKVLTDPREGTPPSPHKGKEEGKRSYVPPGVPSPETGKSDAVLPPLSKGARPPTPSRAHREGAFPSSQPAPPSHTRSPPSPEGEKVTANRQELPPLDEEAVRKLESAEPGLGERVRKAGTALKRFWRGGEADEAATVPGETEEAPEGSGNEPTGEGDKPPTPGEKPTGPGH